MFDFNTTLFLWLNASADSPAWVVPLARFASLELPQWLLAGTAGAFLVGDARVRRGVVRIVLAMLTAWLMARLAQHLWPMPRPFSIGLGTAWVPHGDSAGFPSTHTSAAFAFASVVATFTHRRSAGIVALLVAGLVAWSRISLGLHFPVDVFAGAIVGFFSAWASGLAQDLALQVRPAHDPGAAGP